MSLDDHHRERFAMRYPAVCLAAALGSALGACGSNASSSTSGSSNAGLSSEAATAEPEVYRAALADPARPAADRERDAARMPAELLTFAEVVPGEKVGDYVMGGGYWTGILSNLVGPQGRVYAFQPAEFIGFRPAYAEEQDAAVAGRTNVTPLRGPLAAPPFPEPLDTIITVQNFHDLYLGAMPEGTATQALAALHGALKPGGTLLVVDHSAADGSGLTSVDTLHRIDRQAALAALQAAGFVVEAQSDLYERPDDPRTANVFDEVIRGKTDQFVLRLRKEA
jgi:predicted methyltransferase